MWYNCSISMNENGAVTSSAAPKSIERVSFLMTSYDSTTPLKRCSKCGNEYPRAQKYFGADKEASDGLKSNCRACAKSSAGEYRKTHSEQCYLAKKRWQQEHSAEVTSYVEKWREANPEKRRAHTAVYLAIHSGHLVKPDTLKCAECGSPAKHYHHWSYAPEHWLDVIPLCRVCHRKLHTAQHAEGCAS